MKVGVLSIKFIFHLKKYLFQWYSQFFLLDKLGPTVFAPVKMDLVGNIKVSVLALSLKTLFGGSSCMKLYSKTNGCWVYTQVEKHRPAIRAFLTGKKSSLKTVP